jgi:hypothetical protein
MKPRTEDDILSQAPIKIKLGQKDYEVKVLTILKARKWRAQLVETLGIVFDSFKQPAVGAALPSAMTSALMEFPEKLTDLIFAYAPELPRETILEEATESQIVNAFTAIMQEAFPFLGPLGMATQVLKSQTPTLLQ